MLAGLPVTSITNSSSGSGYWSSRFAAATANWTGSTSAFVTAVTVVAVWALTGPFYSYSGSWQLVVKTGTTIVTFLMVFLIQNAEQGHESSADQAVGIDLSLGDREQPDRSNRECEPEDRCQSRGHPATGYSSQHSCIILTIEMG
jgi:hypothetical protein